MGGESSMKWMRAAQFFFDQGELHRLKKDPSTPIRRGNGRAKNCGICNADRSKQKK